MVFTGVEDKEYNVKMIDGKQESLEAFAEQQKYITKHTCKQTNTAVTLRKEEKPS